MTDNIIHTKEESVYDLRVNYKSLLGDWYNILYDFIKTEGMSKLMFYLNNFYKIKLNIYPEKKNIFKCFKCCQYRITNVVILNCNSILNDKSNGLAFGNKDNVEQDFDESLIELFNEIEQREYKGVMINKDYTLESWAKQGVLMLNVAPTSYEKLSHKMYWFNFIRFLIKKVSEDQQGLIFVVINSSESTLYSDMINEKKHTILNHKTFDYNVLEDINSNIAQIYGRNYRIKW